MQVTATEFKSNLGYYLGKVHTEDIWITKNGKTIAKLVNPNTSSVDSITGILKGIGPEKLDRHLLREERIAEYEVHD